MSIMFHLPIIVILIPLTAAYLMPLVGYKWKRLCNSFAVVALLLSFLGSIALARLVLTNGPIHYHMAGFKPPWGIELVADYLGAYMCVVISFITLLVALYSKEYITKEVPEPRRPQYYTLFLLLTGSMMGASVTGDLFNLFVCFEILSISSYALVSISGEGKALLAGYKYLLIGAIASSFVLLGIGHLYISAGTLNMADMFVRLPPLYGSWTVLAALALLIVGFSIKTALFPLHVWLPDAYTHAPCSVPVLSTLVIKVGAVAIIRLLFNIFQPSFVMETIPMTAALSWMAAIAIIVASLFAISQTDIKRMLAYSSVCHVAYVILGIGIGTELGLTGGMLHILNHAVTKGCLFLCVGAIIYKTGIRNIRDFGGLGRKMPATMGAFTLAAFSMVGIPPTNGFISKFYLALAAMTAGRGELAVVILLSSLLNAIYFIRIINITYFGIPEEEAEIDEAPLTMVYPIMMLAACCLILGFGAELPLTILRPAAQALLGV